MTDIALRQRIEAAIETLIEVLDFLDGDCDAEEDDPPEDNHDAEQDWGEWGVADHCALNLVMQDETFRWQFAQYRSQKDRTEWPPTFPFVLPD